MNIKLEEAHSTARLQKHVPCFTKNALMTVIRKTAGWRGGKNRLLKTGFFMLDFIEIQLYNYAILSEGASHHNAAGQFNIWT